MNDLQTLYDPSGKRLYLTRDERRAFLDASKTLNPAERTLCVLLHDTGCRISEALALTIGSIDLQSRVAVFETLKRRREGVFRAVPLSDDTLDLLDIVHGLRRTKARDAKETPLWGISRPTAWRIVKRCMDKAGIEDGAHQSPKGLRHGFGVEAILAGVPVTTLKKWMGHAKLTTTAIYLDVVGAEEREIAARMWNKPQT